MSASIRSMTGYARVRRSAGGLDILLSVKTLNHRGLDVHFHTAPCIDPFENAMRALMKGRLSRGHVDVRVSVNRGGGAVTAGLNRPLLAAYFQAFESAAKEFGVESRPDLNVAFRIPGIFGEVEEDLGGDLESTLLEALSEALDQLTRFREREGAEMAAEMHAHNARILAGAGEMERIRERAVPAFQSRLHERLKDLLRTVEIEPPRLAQEAAILADRSDIGEELARLKIHAAQLERLLAEGGEVGKKLDFLLQEMNRETNTILSKTGGIGEPGLKITELALAAKSDIEKIREQALNVE